jgi:periplasmic protein TonB
VTAATGAAASMGGFGTRQWRAFAAAVSLESLIIVGGLMGVALQPPRAIDNVALISIEPAPKVVEGKPPEPNAPLPKPIVVPQPLVQAPKPVAPPVAVAPSQPPVQTPVAVPTPAVVTPVVEPAVATPAPVAKPVVPAQPVAPPPVAAVDPSIAYNGRLAAAVQAAFEVPASAAALNFKGRTRVEFNLTDGVVLAARVIQSSGLGAVDRAAVKAVQAASFPAPPAALQGKEGVYQIWVACL